MTDNIEEAKKAFHEGRGADAITILNKIISQKNNTSDAAAFLLKGLIYEVGGEGVDINLSRAIANYRMAASLISDADSTPLLYVARAQMKLGRGHYLLALSTLQEASLISKSPDLSLGFAHYYEMYEHEIRLARKYYLSAAVGGRYAGFFGLSRTLRLGGFHSLALFVDIARIILGPLIFLIKGRRAKQVFYWE